MPFGRTTDGSVALGAFDLLETQSVMPTIATHAAGVGAQSDVQVDTWAAPSADLIGDVRLGARASVWFGAVLLRATPRR